MDTLKLAWRNVWRNPRRSGVTIAATSLALFVMIFYSGLVSGYLSGMERNVIDVEVGDAQIYAEGYRKRPSLYTKIDDPDALLGRLDGAGFKGSARLLGNGLAAAGDNSAGILLRGLDPERDAAVSKVNTQITSGAWLDPAAQSEVVVGKRLAKTLGVGVGDELVVLSQAADGSTANDLYKVRGVLGPVSDPVDRATVFMNEDAFRELMVFPEGAHQVLVRKPAELPLPEATAEIGALAPSLEAKSWKQIMPVVASMLDTGRSAMMVMFGVVYVAIGIIVLNAMLMAVFERIREFGILKALGVGPGGVLSLIFLETLIQTVIAILIGVAVSVPVNYYMATVGLDLASLSGMSIMGMSMDSVWRSEITTETYTQPILALTMIILLAVIYPAMRAAFVKPLDAIHHQ
ncbi:MAG: ABC transporter permease [Myxococcales bacterium]|nr:ABC transporter permease [Myxococcales bacterium]